MVKLGIGLDIGADSVKVVVGQMKKDFFIPRKAALLKKDGETTDGLVAFLNGLGVKGKATVGVTGREMIIRYTQVPPMPDWQLNQVMGFEIHDIKSQSGGDLSADFNRLAITSSLSEDDTILLTLIKDTLLDATTARLAGTKVSVEGFTPNAIALFNLLSRTADVDTGTSLLLDLGAENMDLAVVQDGSLIFARNISGGSGLFTRAIMESFNLKEAKAERVKNELGCIMTKQGAGNLSPQQEKVARCLAAPASQIYSMIQSSLMFCKAQIKIADLSLDRIFLTGGGARLKGLDTFLGESLHVPVELYDPVSALDLSMMGDDSDLVQNGLEFSSAVGLALMSSTADHYSIQVLPETVKKRQYFQNHTLYGIFAAVFLLVFLGVKFYFNMSDAAVLDKDYRAMTRELDNRERRAREMMELSAENEELTAAINMLDEKVISTSGLIRTLALVQKYLSEDLWITSIEVSLEEREEFGAGKNRKPVIHVQGSGREMNQPLQKSFTEFRQKLDSDPLTRHVIPQIRRGDQFTFSILVNFSSPLIEPPEEEDGEEMDEV